MIKVDFIQYRKKSKQCFYLRAVKPCHFENSSSYTLHVTNAYSNWISRGPLFRLHHGFYSLPLWPFKRPIVDSLLCGIGNVFHVLRNIAKHKINKSISYRSCSSTDDSFCFWVIQTAALLSTSRRSGIEKNKFSPSLPSNISMLCISAAERASAIFSIWKNKIQ